MDKKTQIDNSTPIHATPTLQTYPNINGSPLEDLDADITEIDYKLDENTIGLDIGGSLCKICVFDTSDDPHFFKKKGLVIESCSHFDKMKLNEQESDLTFKYKHGYLHFIKFPTHHFEETLTALKKSGLLNQNVTLNATGGGAHKFSKMILSNFGRTMNKFDEIKTLYNGLNFTLERRLNECYFVANTESAAKMTTELYTMKNVYPYILANIGSGVSIIKVESRDKIERVSGTCIGGGTFFGLCRLLTGIGDFEQLTKLSEKGQTGKVNMTVGDIYGGDYTNFGLSGDIVASAFGKVVSKEDPWKDLDAGDISLSIGLMICVNIAQIAHFCAERHGIKRVLFAGNFMRKNPLCEMAITKSLKYYSAGKSEALFLEHEGYFGAIGCLLGEKEDLVKE